MKKLLFSTIITFFLISCSNGSKEVSESNHCKYKTCTNETAGWDNYKTNSSYTGPMSEGSFRLSETGGSFCSQDHAKKALD